MAGGAEGVRGAGVLAAAALMLTTAAAAPDPVQALSGRYGVHFRNGNVDGAEFWSDDVVEIVPLDAAHAYFRVRLSFFNGHSCAIRGVAEPRGTALDYQAPARSGLAGCHMTLSRKGAWLNLDDHDGSCSASCGARGGYAAGGLPWKSRRPITYLSRLKASPEYREALTEAGLR